jgi:prolyl-tRNA editing enzyme YbaK/EbsC (Cys-tRNA(Pro) deacylase)
MMLSSSAQSIQKFLSSKGIETTVVELAASTRTADEAARAIGCMTAQITKSLIFRTKMTKKPILVLASGVNRVQEKLLVPYVKEEIEKADADFVRSVTGFAIGGIPPIGHAQPIQTFIDADLLQYDILWAAAGTPHAVFKLTPDQLLQLTKGQVIQIKT